MAVHKKAVQDALDSLRYIDHLMTVLARCREIIATDLKSGALDRGVPSASHRMVVDRIAAMDSALRTPPKEASHQVYPLMGMFDAGFTGIAKGDVDDQMRGWLIEDQLRFIESMFYVSDKDEVAKRVTVVVDQWFSYERRLLALQNLATALGMKPPSIGTMKTGFPAWRRRIERFYAEIERNPFGDEFLNILKL